MDKNIHGCNVNWRNKRRKETLFLFVAGMLLFASPLFSLEKESVSVGVVNVTFLMENAPQSDLASNKLKEKFFPQEKKLAEELEKINDLENGLEKLNANKQISADLKRQKQRKLRSLKRARTRSLQDFREELRFSRDAALDDVQREVFSAINDVRKQQNIDIIIQDYISANKRVDITPLVLEYLRNKLNGNTKKPDPNAKKSETKFPPDSGTQKDIAQ